MKLPATTTSFYVRLTIRLNYRPFGSDSLYNPAEVAASRFVRARLAEILKSFLENLVPGFLFEVRIDAVDYGPGDGTGE